MSEHGVFLLTGPSAAGIDELYAAFVNGTPRIGLWLDTSDQTPDETVDEIVARADEALLRR